MNDMSNQGQFRTFPVDSASDFPAATPPAPPVSAPRPASYVGNTAIHSENAAQPIGVVLEIAGSSSHIALDLERRLLSRLDAGERASLDALLDKLGDGVAHLADDIG